MSKNLLYYYFFSIFLGSSIYIASRLEVQLPKVVRFYVNDFLIIPIVLISSLFVIRKLKNDNDYKISLANVLYVSFLYAIIFEFWLPTFHNRYTSDYTDVALYFLSGFVFHILQKKNT